MRAAPRPANISTKEAADWAKNWAPDSFATALASSVLPVPGGPCSRIPFGTVAPERLEGLRFAQELDDLLQLGLGVVHARDVGEGDPLLGGRLDLLWLVLGITFNIRHITTMMIVKNRIAITGSQLSAQFWISCANEVCTAGGTIVVWMWAAVWRQAPWRLPSFAPTSACAGGHSDELFRRRSGRPRGLTGGRLRGPAAGGGRRRCCSGFLAHRVLDSL